MSIVVSPGPQESLLETDKDGNMYPDAKITQPWYLFFQQLIFGDSGTAWAPIATNLAFTGAAPTITGYYYQNQGFTDFWIKIVPGTNTSSTAGTTYIDLPFPVSVDTGCIVGGTPGAVGFIDSNTKRCFPPAWTNSVSVITINGRVVSQ